MKKLFKHYNDIEPGEWIWENFTPKEIACKGTGEIVIDPHTLNCLQQARYIIGEPLRINSAYRSPLHNARVGGAPLSRHKYGDAIDISLRGHNKQELIEVLRAVGFKGFGLRYKSFIHVDTWRARQW